MKKLEFKPEMFPGKTLTYSKANIENVLDRDEAALCAQSVFDKWYSENIENAPVFYGPIKDNNGFVFWCSAKTEECTHKSKTICIEPIEQPKKTKQVWQWRYLAGGLTGVLKWNIDTQLRDEKDAIDFYSSGSFMKYEKHLGPYEVSE